MSPASDDATLNRIFGPIWLVAGVSMLFMARLHWRAGKKKYFWLALCCGIGFLFFGTAAYLWPDF